MVISLDSNISTTHGLQLEAHPLERSNRAITHAVVILMQVVVVVVVFAIFRRFIIF